MFGGSLNVPVPDVDRTDHLLMLGANPFASNGSLATAPDWPGRLERLVERGGKLVVVDPRRSRTAEAATEWVPMRPGADAYLLMAMVQVIVEEDLVSLGASEDLVTGLDEVVEACAPFTPEVVEAACGIAAADIRRLARELAAAPSACVYGRIGTTTAEFGTITSWLVDVLNVLTGNLDRPGGVDVHHGGRRVREHAGHAALRQGRQAAPAPHPGPVACPRRWASCRSSPSPRRSTPRERARSGRSSPSPATRCCRRRTRPASTRPSPASSAWSRSTST